MARKLDQTSGQFEKIAQCFHFFIITYSVEYIVFID